MVSQFFKGYSGLIHRYKEFLPINEKTPIITLLEGNTPLIKLSHIPKKLGLDAEIFVKFEGLNPTGSFKDRGMCMAISKAKESGAKAVICASTGNTSASAAAYAQKAGMLPIVIIPQGKIAKGKLLQAVAYSAEIIQIKGNFDDAMEFVKEISNKTDIALVNSVNPYRLQGQKTASFEIIDDLGVCPDYHAIPVGNAGNISAYWMGFKEYFEKEKSDKTPIMLGFQAKGANPFVTGKAIKNPETIASAIRIGNPQSWDLALEASKKSGGYFDCYSDEEILETQYLLSSVEGIFCEPASAVSLCGVIDGLKKGKIKKGSLITCTLTGNGIKDPDAIDFNRASMHEVECDLNQIFELINKMI